MQGAALYRGAAQGELALAEIVAERYDGSMGWADRLLREQPRHGFAMRTKVAVCAHLGRLEEAREWLRRLLEVQPSLTIAWHKAYAQGLVPPKVVALYVEGLRKAGLPEA